MDFRAPAEWAPMSDADTPVADRDASWWARCDFVDVKLTSPEAKLVGALLRRGVRRARLVKLERVQSRKLWVKYEQAQHWIALREGGDTNEQLLLNPRPPEVAALATGMADDNSGKRHIWQTNDWREIGYALTTIMGTAR